jgi:hypothetical protein
MFDAEYDPQMQVMVTRVDEWMTAFEVPNDLDLQEALIMEEAREVIEVFHMEPSPEAAAEMLKEISDFMFVMLGYQVMMNRMGILVPVFQPETLTAARVVTELFGRAFDEENDDLFINAFHRVCDSNMTKLVDGKPLRREDGKVLKGPNYKAPDLSDLGRQLVPELA